MIKEKIFRVSRGIGYTAEEGKIKESDIESSLGLAYAQITRAPGFKSMVIRYDDHSYLSILLD